MSGSDFAFFAIVGLFCVGAVVGAVALVVWAFVGDARDARALEQWAAQHGWRLTGSASLPFEHALPERRHGRAKYVMHTTVDGWPITTAQWSYEVDILHHEDKRWATVTAVELPQSLPRMSVTPHGRIPFIPTKLLEHAFANTTAVTLGHAAFDAAFEVEVDEDDVDAALRLLGPRVATELLGQGDATWGFADNVLFSWTEAVTDPELLQPKVDGLLRVATSLGK